MSNHFNFKSECLAKFDEEVFSCIMDSFECLPIAALVDDRILGIHGGISPSMVEKGLSVINKIDRFAEVSDDPTFVDLLWSDPADGK
jgi:diadenosine tetraphosphatase ApaH/serine/threonine PP2A family protein phosphatase